MQTGQSFSINTNKAVLDACARFFLEMLARVFEKHNRSQEIIYHYTNSTAFHSIVNTDSLHATHISFMNDRAEYQHAVDMLIETAEIRRKTNLTAPQIRIVDALLDDLKAASPENYHPIFIASFSRDSNELNQWRAYGGGGASFNLGLKISHLRELIVEQQKTQSVLGYVTPVVYDSASKADLVERVLDFIVQSYPIHEQQHSKNDKAHVTNHRAFADNWIRDFSPFAALLAPIIKNENFKQENEWRVILYPRDLSLVKFKPKLSLLAPYFPLNLKHTFEGFDDPIRHIVVGPGHYEDINHGAATAFIQLRRRKMPVIDRSKILIRDVN